MKKYLVYGQQIKSKNDNDWHYVSARRVAELYNVNPSECIMIDGNPNTLYNWNKTRGLNKEKLIMLYPDFNGDYDLKKLIEKRERL